MNDLTHIDLFSGIGGFALAAGWARFRTIAFCEIDPFCQEVLKARFGAVADTEHDGLTISERGNRGGESCQGGPKEQGRIEQSARSDSQPPLLIPDVFTLDGTRFRGATLLTGGFPCQPFSHAGKRRGKEDDRAIWPQMLRVIKEARPAWVIGENVSGLISMELDSVLADLELEGYTGRTFHIGAVGVNAPHRRMRVWIVGCLAQHAGISPEDKFAEENNPSGSLSVGKSDSDAPDASDEGLQGRVREQSLRHVGLLGRNGGDQERSWEEDWIEVATRFCRVDDGLPAWVHACRVARLKALGNAIVPQVAYQIIKGIGEIEQSPRVDTLDIRGLRPPNQE